MHETWREMDATGSMMIYIGLPDPNLLTALGEVAVRAGQLERVLRMARRSFTGRSVATTLQETKRKSTSAVRQELERLAAHALSGDTLEAFKSLLSRAWKASDERNRLLHGVWANELDGQDMLSVDDLAFCRAPVSTDLKVVADELDTVSWEIIKLRFGGVMPRPWETG